MIPRYPAPIPVSESKSRNLTHPASSETLRAGCQIASKKPCQLPANLTLYPPYTSKYNPIEHRLFPHLTRACRGVIFQTLETARYYMAKTETTTGLKVQVSILEKVYATGRKCTAGFKKSMKIVFDSFLPKWNYRAVPEPL